MPLAVYDQSRRQMFETHRGIRRIDVLAARPARPGRSELALPQQGLIVFRQYYFLLLCHVRKNVFTFLQAGADGIGPGLMSPVPKKCGPIGASRRRHKYGKPGVAGKQCGHSPSGICTKILRPGVVDVIVVNRGITVRYG